MFDAVSIGVKAPDFDVGATEVDARDFLHVVTVSAAPIEFYRLYFTQEVGAGEQFPGLLRFGWVEAGFDRHLRATYTKTTSSLHIDRKSLGIMETTLQPSFNLKAS